MFEKLKQLRLSRHIPAKSIANLIELDTPSAYYKKEKGLIKFSLEDAKKISDYFGESIEEIFFDK